MKRSKPWLTLILTASVLLLSGVRNAQGIGATPNQVPSPPTTEPTKAPNHEGETKSERGITPSATAAHKQNRPAPSADEQAEIKDRESSELALNRLLTAYTGQLATYTWWLVFVGIVSAVIAFLQAVFVFVSIQEHLRPKIRIRSLTMVNDLATNVEDKAPFRFALTLVNHGGTGAKVISGNFTIHVLPMKDIPTFGYGEPAFRPPYTFLKGQTIPCGPDFLHSESDQYPHSEPEIRNLIEGKTFLHVVGLICYKGRFQLRAYKLGFARTYDATLGKFVPSTEPEFEFAD